jgi:hypothetical protein
MRAWRSAAVSIGVMGGLVVLLGLALSSPTVAQDGDDDDVGTLQTQVAALQTQVAVLQTQVADLQPDATAAEATPDGTPTACGRPFANWGAASADDVEVQLLQVSEVGELPSDIAAESAIAVELVVTNQSTDPVPHRLSDFEATLCDGQVVTAAAGGPTPAIGDGEIAPGDSVRGWVLFPLPAGAQAAEFTVHIESPGRTGAMVMCPLVDRNAPPTSLDDAAGGAGCSAVGGSG